MKSSVVPQSELVGVSVDVELNRRLREFTATSEVRAHGVMKLSDSGRRASQALDAAAITFAPTEPGMFRSRRGSSRSGQSEHAPAISIDATHRTAVLCALEELVSVRRSFSEGLGDLLDILLAETPARAAPRSL
jgi:hypothetical protein